MSSYLEDLFAERFDATPEGQANPYVRQYRFAAENVGCGRGVRERLKEEELQDWRFDFCWPDLMCAVEIDGGERMKNSRHISPEGFRNDCAKLNAATLLGWKFLRFTGSRIKKDVDSCLQEVAALLSQSREDALTCSACG